MQGERKTACCTRRDTRGLCTKIFWKVIFIFYQWGSTRSWCILCAGASWGHEFEVRMDRYQTRVFTVAIIKARHLRAHTYVPVEISWYVYDSCLLPIPAPIMAVTLLVLLSSFLLYFLYSVACWVKKTRRRYRMKRENGCLPPRKLPQIDPFLGTDVVIANLRAAKNYGFLKLLKSRHEANGLTFTTKTYFRTTINTCDPMLIQSVLSFQFQDFGMGPLRRKSASPLLGRGIFGEYFLIRDFKFLPQHGLYLN